MILIFGGAYQGKLDYALEKYNLTESDVYRCDIENQSVPERKKIIYGIDKWIYSIIDSDSDIEIIKNFTESLSDEIVICDDISCGVVPIDSKKRLWRETVGRTLAILAKQSDEAVRVFCGIPTKLK